MEHFFNALFGLILQQGPFLLPPYQPQPPIMAQQPQPPPTNDGARSHPVIHNGSLMTLTVWPDKTIEIAYAQPKAELVAIGVRPGTLLIRGQWREDRTFAGVAHVFNYCGAMPYAVTGKVTEGGSFVMEGPAPRVWAGTCQVADYVWSANSYLQFDRLADQSN
jgi:hypothetical protein